MAYVDGFVFRSAFKSLVRVKFDASASTGRQ